MAFPAPGLRPWLTAQAGALSLDKAYCECPELSLVMSGGVHSPDTHRAARLAAASVVSANLAQPASYWRARGDALHAAGDARAGGEAHLMALGASTQEPAMVAAAVALNKGDLAAAEKLLKRQLKAAPTDVGAMRMLAELAVRLGRNPDAEALLDRALELAPGFDAARFARALVLSRLNRLPEAMAETDLLLARAPDNIGYLNLRASVLVRLGDYEAARAVYVRVLAARPDQPKIWMSLGHVLKTMGQTTEGVDAYRRSLVMRPELGESWWSLANLKVFTFTQEDVTTMEAALRAPGADEEDRLHLHFALGKAYEDAGEYPQSFDHYAKGNATRRAQIDYSSPQLSTRIARLKGTLTPAFFEERADYGCPAPDPIFIMGLPRAGSTLLEQILASHPSVEGTMELPDMDKIARRLRTDGENVADVLAGLTRADCKALGEEYLERTRVQRRLGRPLFIDKLPNNWLHVGLIHLILPNARIIDARRHPMACCFSAWKQHFARGQSFSYDLAELGQYYVDYVALMAHFDAVLPGRVLRVIHEDMVDDPETEIRRLLDAVGLPFDQRCIDFHQTRRAVRTASSEQVRRPISRDGVDQWRNFSAFLGPLATALAPVMESWNEAAQPATPARTPGTA
jgi:tetratricopeptide (TPR) repeat protein